MSKMNPSDTKPVLPFSRRDLLAGASGGAAGLAAMALPISAAAHTGGSTPITAAQPSSRPDLPWPPAASFASKAVVGPHQPSAAVMMDPRELLGLPVERVFIYGNLRWADGEMSEWVRGFYMGSLKANQGLFVQSTRGKDTLRSAPELFMPAARRWTATMEGDRGVWRQAADETGKPFEFSMAADGSTIAWTEDGLLNITGRLLGPGLQWHIPDVGGSTLYVSQIYEMTGTALGQPVRGVMAFDKVHQPVDQPLYSGKDNLFRPDAHHRTWYTWANRYEDGGYDAGHFVLGTDRMGFALLTNERNELVLDTDVSGTVELMPDMPWLKRVTVQTSRGDRWILTPDPRGRMPDMLNGGDTQATTPQNEGQWFREGETRKPVAWFAWGEAAPRGRTEYTQKYRD